MGDGKKMERKLSLMDVDEVQEEDLVTVLNPFEQDKCAHEDNKCGKVEYIEETIQSNTDCISVTLSLDGGSVEESKLVEEHSTMDTAVDSRTDGGDNACVDASQSIVTATDTVINTQTNNEKKETITPKVLQRARKVSYKNGGSLNSDVSKKIMNKDDKLKFSNGKEETKEKGGKDSSEG